ncbi:MAG: uncharacterized protein QG555_1373 [Thermodesulfobacteriota bacterium]|nr:uncharacterized protein [Thermodesulfobacteriota bacterium]
MKTWRIDGVPLALDEDVQLLSSLVAAILHIDGNHIDNLQIIRKSLDARRNRPPRFIYNLSFTREEDWSPPANLPAGVKISNVPAEPEPAAFSFSFPAGKQVVVVGCGPAGLFAALFLALHDCPVLLLERGGPVEERHGDVQSFWTRGILLPESNVYFGEGGAGTFSDGKLTSRVRNPYTVWVKKILVEMGAAPEILTDAKPHIGSDRLRKVLINLRKHLLSMGCQVRFHAKMTDLIIHNNHLEGIVVNGVEEIKSDQLVLAIGQSSEETYRLLADRGVELGSKAFAMGLRVEHPQEHINRIQYGRWMGNSALPPADYTLTARLRELNRSVYSFCMCPGGQVIGSSSRDGGIVTNGMSLAARQGSYANSAIVVNVHPEDYDDYGPPGLSGLAFRRSWEERAFTAGGGNYRAPAQGLINFLDDRDSPETGATTFLPGVTAVTLKSLLPDYVYDSLRTGIRHFQQAMPGFITAEANLIGVETRTSSPVRITRGEDGQSARVRGIYPCGEGAGYAGGIISSALDGIRAALNILNQL